MLANPVVTDWLKLSPPATRTPTRPRASALCTRVDAAPSWLVPCFVLNRRFVLCATIGDSQLLPVAHTAWWARFEWNNTAQRAATLSRTAHPSHSMATASSSHDPSGVTAAGNDMHTARAIVDLDARVVIEAHQIPQNGTVFRIILLDSEEDHPRSLVLPVADGAAYPREIVEVVYNRECARCGPLVTPCDCPRDTTLERASPARAHESSPLSEEWAMLGEILHRVFHGAFHISGSVHAISPHGHVTLAQHDQDAFVAQRTMSVTINDPPPNSLAPTQALAPRPLLPRPGPVPASSSA